MRALVTDKTTPPAKVDGRKTRKKGINKTVPGMPYARRRQVGEPPKQWNPEYAARIPWYPKTPEAFAVWCQKKRERMLKLKEMGCLPTRRGIPDGFGGRKEEVLQMRAKAHKEAKEIVRYMREKDLIASEDPRAEEALEAMIGIVRAKDEQMDAPLYRANERISAAKVVLDFTKQRPTSKVDAVVTRAEDFLAVVVADMQADKD